MDLLLLDSSFFLSLWTHCTVRSQCCGCFINQLLISTQHTWTCCEIVCLGHGSGYVSAAGFLNASCFLRWSVSSIGSWSACRGKTFVRTFLDNNKPFTSTVLTCALSEIWTSSSSIWTLYETECAFCSLCLQKNVKNQPSLWGVGNAGMKVLFS